MKHLLLLLLLSSFSFAAQKAVVIIPAADVWRMHPGLRTPSADERETQVLYGERVVVHQTMGSWARIEAVDQPEYSSRKKWEGYPGWIDRKAIQISKEAKAPEGVLASTWTVAIEPESAPDVWLSLGSFLRPTGKTHDLWVVSTPLGDRAVSSSTARKWPASTLVHREGILNTARKMLGTAYLWGGLTAPQSPTQKLITPSTQFGVDCSALVHLSYRVQGLTIPRDSHEQWMKAAPIKRAELRPADLIFSAKASDPEKVTHVTIYAGGEQLVEAPQTGMTVRQVSFKDKYGAEFTSIESGQTVGDRVLYYGRFIP